MLDSQEKLTRAKPNEQNRKLAQILPLILSILTIITLLILSFTYKVYEHPFLIDEGGVIETLSAVSYFLCVLVVILVGKWSYIKKYYYFLILVISFGFRELDFDKRFTTMGVFKIKFYLSSNVPVMEKLAGLLVIAILIYVAIAIIKNHSKKFFYKIKQGSPVHIGVLLTFLLLAFTKSIDGIGRKLSDLNFIITEQTSIYFEVLEEVLELGIPLLIISVFIMYFSAEKREKSLLNEKNNKKDASSTESVGG